MEQKSDAIYKAVIGVMSEVGAIGKNKVLIANGKTQYKFRGIDDVMNALHPAMVKNEVFVVPETLEQLREERSSRNGGNLIYSVCKVRYTFYTIDGSSISATVIGEGMDSGDKATNKAMSAAYKYACFQVFCIPTEEMDDPDAESHEAEGKQPEPPEQETALIDGTGIAKINGELQRTGIDGKVILEAYAVKDLGELTRAQLDAVLKKFKKTPDKSDKKEGGSA